MKIKSGQEIKVTFYAKALEDVDSYIFMDWLMDNISGFRVSNPGYREIGKKVSHPTTSKEQMKPPLSKMETPDWQREFDDMFLEITREKGHIIWKDYEYVTAHACIKDFISSLLTSERTRLIEEVEGWLDKMPIYEVDDAPPEFCAGYNECVSAWKTYVLELKSNLTALKKGGK